MAEAACLRAARVLGKCLLYFRERVCLGKECLNLKQIESLQ